MRKVQCRNVPTLQSLIRLAVLVIALLPCCPPTVRGEETYTFDQAEIEKKPWHLGGYAEIRPVINVLDKDAALYQLQYYKDDPGSTITEYNGRFQLDGSYEKGMGRVYIKTSTDYSYSSESGGNGQTVIYEGYATLKPSDSWKLEAGKKNLKWGKGYAWNPVNFLDRIKDPYDPELSLEGYVMATVDYIRSFEGPVRTLAITPVLFPVNDHINDDVGEDSHLNVAVKLYLLFYDTDLDLIYAGGGTRTPRYGMDFSRNLSTNFEVHGELASIQRFRKQEMDTDGTLGSETHDTLSGLLGVRHLTTFDLTTILEYYHNGTGYSANEMTNYFNFIHSGYQSYQSTGSDRQLVFAQNLTKGSYSRPSPMEDYLYLKLSQKEPLDILYFTPSVTVMINLNDQSHSITPELLYTGITNMELRLRVGSIRGARDTEYGEKQNDYRFEFRSGYYF
jgi:hypothetical protein